MTKLWSYEFDSWIFVPGGGGKGSKSKGKGKGMKGGGKGKGQYDQSPNASNAKRPDNANANKGKGKFGKGKNANYGRGKGKGKEVPTLSPWKNPDMAWMQCLTLAEGKHCRGWCFKGEDVPKACKYCSRGWDSSKEFFFNKDSVTPISVSPEVAAPEIATKMLKALTEELGVDKEKASSVLKDNGLPLPKEKVVTIEKTAVQLLKAESELSRLDNLISQQMEKYAKIGLLLEKSHDVILTHSCKRAQAQMRVDELRELQLSELTHGASTSAPYVAESNEGEANFTKFKKDIKEHLDSFAQWGFTNQNSLDTMMAAMLPLIQKLNSLVADLEPAKESAPPPQDVCMEEDIDGIEQEYKALSGEEDDNQYPQFEAASGEEDELHQAIKKSRTDENAETDFIRRGREHMESLSLPDLKTSVDLSKMPKTKAIQGARDPMKTDRERSGSRTPIPRSSGSND